MGKVLIIGGGLIGSTLYIALKSLGFSVQLVDAEEQHSKLCDSFDARSIALSLASQRILKMINIWPLIEHEATPITSIHISEQKHFGSSCLKDEHLNPLGYVVEIQKINQGLNSLLDKKDILRGTLTELDPSCGKASFSNPDKAQFSLQADIVVAADGTLSKARDFCNLTVRTKNYKQHAIVANVGLSRHHACQAFERFTSEGAIAMLPLTHKRCAMVWSLPFERSKEVMAYSDEKFLRHVQETFGYRLGRFIKVGHRAIYPLQQSIMSEKVKERVVFIGNAAHTLHPVAGQGFNLGLRDVAMLVQCIRKKGIHKDTLYDYQCFRKHDQQAISWFTDSLITLFNTTLPGLGALRGIGLFVFDQIIPAKNLVKRYTQGFADSVPHLACEIELERL